MQSDSLDIVGALTCLISTVKETNKLKTKPLSKWPMYSATLGKIALEDGEHVYQCQTLQNLSHAVQNFENSHAEYYVKITECIQTRLEWSDMGLFRDIIVMLATQGWQKLLKHI